METQGRGVLDTDVLAREVVIHAMTAEGRTNAAARVAAAQVAEAKERQRLSRERHGARSGERAGELGKDRQVGVQPNPIQTTDPER
jgi:hypothetical protein